MHPWHEIDFICCIKLSSIFNEVEFRYGHSVNVDKWNVKQLSTDVCECFEIDCGSGRVDEVMSKRIG